MKGDCDDHVEIIPIPGFMKGMDQKGDQYSRQISPVMEFEGTDKSAEFPGVVTETAGSGKCGRFQDTIAAQAL